MGLVKQLFDPSTIPTDEQLTVCSLEVPSKQDIWNAAIEAPGEAWRGAKSLMPSLTKIRTLETTDVSFSQIGGVVLDRGKSAAGTATDAVKGKWRQFESWLSE